MPHEHEDGHLQEACREARPRFSLSSQKEPAPLTPQFRLLVSRTVRQIDVVLCYSVYGILFWSSSATFILPNFVSAFRLSEDPTLPKMPRPECTEINKVS